jgi:hypothetical protein
VVSETLTQVPLGTAQIHVPHLDSMHPICNIILDECVSLSSPKHQEWACVITTFYLELTHPSRGVEVNLGWHKLSDALMTTQVMESTTLTQTHLMM